MNYIHKKNIYNIVLRIIYLLIFSVSSSAYALDVGSLMIAPTRVKFEPRDRIQEINVINNNSGQETYRITTKNMTVDKDGNYANIDTPQRGELFADSYIRFSPRQVTLEPGESQKVKIMVRRKKDMIDGEYRSHLVFTNVPSGEKGGSDVEKTNNKDAQSISINIRPILSISIPIIVENGNVSSTAKIDNIEYNKKSAEVNFNLLREGNKSVYGSLIIVQDNGDKKPVELARINGLSVLYPYESRKITMNLDNKKLIPGSPIKIKYVEYNNDNIEIASADLKL